MEALFAIAIGTLTSCAVYLLLRARTYPVLLGLTLLSYAVNLFLFASGAHAVLTSRFDLRKGVNGMQLAQHRFQRLGRRAGACGRNQRGEFSGSGSPQLVDLLVELATSLSQDVER